MNLNGVEVNKDQLWVLIQDTLRSAGKREGGAVNEVLAAVAENMGQLDMLEGHHRQELVNLLRLED